MDYIIYLVEDDKNLNQILKTYLEREGYRVRSFFNGLEAEKALAERPDLWILDIMLPDIDGYELLKKIKAQDQTNPVIFISARDSDIDRVIGLEFGSDDYLAKPFLPRELVLRVNNLMDKLHREDFEILSFPPYTINKSSRNISLGGQVLDLTTKEWEMVLLLCSNKDQALSREEILTRLWGPDYFGSTRVVDDLIRRVRKKLPYLNIETIYGFGYRVVDYEEV